MPGLAYQLGVRAYQAGMTIAAKVHPKARARWQGLRQQQGVVSALAATKTAKRLWIHAASLGEFEQARPIIEQWKQLHPQWDIIISFYSPSGYEHRLHYPLAKAVLYLPYDVPQAMSAFVASLQPDLVVVIKYEFWLNWLTELHRRNIPVVLAAGRFHPGQPFFRWYGSSFRKALTWFSRIAVQDHQSRDLLRTILPNLPVTVAYDTRFDRVAAVAAEMWHDDKLAAFCGNKPVIVTGSVWPADLRILQEAIRNDTHYRWIIVPHEIDEPHLSALEKLLPKPSVRYTAADAMVGDADILLLDKMGMLSKVYRYGVAAYVGGGFGKGIHSILEPAAYGIPVAFGPEMKTFPEAKALLQTGGAQMVHASHDAVDWLNRLADDAHRQKGGKAAAQYVADHLGGTAQTISLMEELIRP